MELNERSRRPLVSSYTAGKILLFSLAVFLSACLQSSFFSALAIFSAIPDLVLLCVIGIAVYDGEKSGAVAGVFGGVVIEAFGAGGNIMMLPLFYMLCGFFFGIAAHLLFNKNFISWLLYCVIGAAFRAMLSVIHAVLVENDVNVLLIFTEIVIPEYFITIILSPLMYLPIKAVVRPFHKKIEME